MTAKSLAERYLKLEKSVDFDEASIADLLALRTELLAVAEKAPRPQPSDSRRISGRANVIREYLTVGALVLHPQTDPLLCAEAESWAPRLLGPGLLGEVRRFIEYYLQDSRAQQKDLDALSGELRQLQAQVAIASDYLELMNFVM